MDGFIKILEKYFVPAAGRLGAQRHLLAIRDGFIAIMPLAIIGSLAVLLNNFPIPAYQEFMAALFGSSWTVFGNYIYYGTFAIISLLIVFTISFHLAGSYDSDPLTAGLVGLAGYIILLLQPLNGTISIPFQWLGAPGLFVAIFTALISTEILVRIMHYTTMSGEMGGGLSPVLTRSFAALLPAAAVLAFFSIIKIIFIRLGIINIIEALYSLIQAPLEGMANTLGTALIIVFLGHFFWFLGLHGSNILEPVIQAMYLPALQENLLAAANKVPVPNIFTKPFFDSFVYMGGCGTTISLLLACYLFSRKRRHRELVKLSTAQGVFNINEPVLYGLPVVLNPVLLIPFILTPLILTTTSYFATLSGLIPRTIAMVPWTTPPLISGFLVTGSIAGSLLQIFNILLGAVIYLPFMIIAERTNEENMMSKGEYADGDGKTGSYNYHPQR